MDACTHDAIGTSPLPTTTLTHAPFLSETIRQQNHAFMPCDGRFAASARFLAGLWRRDHELAAATRQQTTPKGKTVLRPAGWLLRRDAAQAGATFLTTAILEQAREALLFREPGSLWAEDRLWGHLLSSQAMTVNLIAPMMADLALATRVWRTLLPGLVGTVTRIRLEFSPGRFDADLYYGDGTALDALIEVVSPLGEIGVIGVELNYVEGMTGPPATPRERYFETAHESGLYKNPDSPTLARAGFEQLRREQVMLSLMLRHGLASRGAFVLIAPQLSRRAQAVAALYRTELVDPEGRNDPATVAFANITVERVVMAMHEAGAGDLAHQLWRRYCDHERVARFALHGDEPPSGPILPLPPSMASSVDEVEVLPATVEKAATPAPSRPSVASQPARLRPKPTSSSAPAASTRRRATAGTGVRTG